MVWNVYSAYAPQMGRSDEEKRDKFEEVVSQTPQDQGLIVGGDLNVHLGEVNGDHPEEHGQMGYGTTNEEGVRMLETLQAMNMTAINTCFRKKEEQLVTYRSGNQASQIDFILMKKEDRARITDCKVLPLEAVTRQHRLLVADLKTKKEKLWKPRKGPQKIKVWKLKENAKEFNEQVKVMREEKQNAGKPRTVCEMWGEMQSVLNAAAEKVCGRTSGRRCQEKESWWWDEEVQRRLKEKKEAYKKMKKGGDSQEYKEKKKQAKREVARAKEEAWKEWYDNLGTRHGEKTIYRIAKTRAKQKKDITQTAVIKNANQKVMTKEDDIKRRWQEYFKELLNVQNERGELEQTEAVAGLIEEITLEEVRQAVRQLKTGKATGPSGVTADQLRSLDEEGLSWLMELLKKIVYDGEIPSDWTKSCIVPIYKEKGDPMECKNYRGIKLLEHGLKVLERILDMRLRSLVEIDEDQFGFRRGKGTTEAIFIVTQIQEKTLEKQEKLYYAFLDLEKAYDRVPRDIIYWSLRKKGVPEALVRIVEMTYWGATTYVRTQYRDTEEFSIDVGLHQGSALSPFLFITIMEVLTKGTRDGLPWELMYADDVVLAASMEEELQRKVLAWQEQLQRGGLKVNLEKSEVMVSEREGGSRVSIVDTGGKELNQVDEFKYLGMMINKEGGSMTAVRQRVKVAWHKWRELTGVICNKKILKKLKCLIYKTVVRPVMLYGAECWTAGKKEEALIERTEMRMLRRIAGVTVKDMQRSEKIREECGVLDIKLKMREARLRWFGHVVRREEEEDIRRTMAMEIKGKQRRGRPKKRWIDCVEKDMEEVKITMEDATDCAVWRRRTQTADPRTVWDPGGSRRRRRRRL